MMASSSTYVNAVRVGYPGLRWQGRFSPTGPPRQHLMLPGIFGIRENLLDYSSLARMMAKVAFKDSKFEYNIPPNIQNLSDHYFKILITLVEGSPVFP